MILAVDFDNTIARTAYPEILAAYEEPVFFLRKWRRKGHKLILWTCREGAALAAALEFCERHGIVFDAVNDNLPESIEKFGANSRKVYADMYIDDKSALPSWRFIDERLK